MEKYRLLRELGKGGTSRVFLGAGIQDGRRYAIKRYEARDGFEAARERFEVVKEWQHPGLPVFAEILREGEGGSIVMEYVPGMTLKERIFQEGLIAEEQAVKWGIEICGILSYLHRQDPAVIYRDLKPGNIMITPLSRVKLIDFGAAIFSRSGMVQVAVPVGTRGYAAPEQFIRNGAVDSRIDIYGFGAVMFHMLTGRHPTAAGGELLDAIQEERRISRRMKRILSRCVEPSPEHRYHFCEEIKRDLENPECPPLVRGEFRILRSEIVCSCMGNQKAREQY